MKNILNSFITILIVSLCIILSPNTILGANNTVSVEISEVNSISNSPNSHKIRYDFKTIDGNSKDWIRDKFISLNNKEQCPNPKNWKGPDDLSAKVAIAWDRKYLYVVAKVTDNVFSHKGSRVLDGDCLYLIFDINGDSDSTIPATLKDDIIISASEVFLQPTIEYSKFSGTISKSIIDEKLVINKIDETHYTYEMAVGWETFEHIAPFTNSNTKLKIGLNDGDGNGYKSELETPYTPIQFDFKNHHGAFIFSNNVAVDNGDKYNFKIGAFSGRNEIINCHIILKNFNKEIYNENLELQLKKGGQFFDVYVKCKTDELLELKAEVKFYSAFGIKLSKKEFEFCFFSKRKFEGYLDKYRNKVSNLSVDSIILRMDENSFFTKNNTPKMAESLLVCAVLRVNRLVDLLEQPTPGKLNLFIKYMQEIEDYFASLSKKELPLARDRKDVLRGFISKDDGSIRPYTLHIGRTTNFEQDTPGIVITLHGNGASTDMSWVDHTQAIEFIANYNAILLQPSGRNNYIGLGENDVIEALKDAMMFYNIDPERIYIIGFGEGGAAALRIAAHYPDYFAGATIIAPSIDFSLQNETKLLYANPVCQNVLFENSPLMLAENLLNIRIDIVHDVNDTIVPIVHSRNLSKVLDNLNHSDFKFHEVEYKGHEKEIVNYSFKMLYNNMESCKVKINPKNVNYSTYNLKYNKAAWLEISGMEDYNKKASITASTGKTTNVITNNVDCMKINWKNISKDPRYKSQALYIDGQNTKVISTNDGWCSYIKDKNKWQLVEKIPENERMISSTDIFASGEIVIVHSPTEEYRNLSNRLLQNWKSLPNNSQSTFNIETIEEALNNKTLEKYNIILLIDKEDQDFLKNISQDLPVKISKTDIMVGDKKYAEKDTGLLFSCPNPYNRSKNILVITGNSFEALNSIKNFYMFLPDIVVFNSKTDFRNPNTFIDCYNFSKKWTLVK